MDASGGNQLQSIWGKVFFYGTVILLGTKISWWLAVLAIPIWIGLGLLMAFGLQPTIVTKFGLTAATKFAWASAPIRAVVILGVSFLLF